jgi:hypothetical protein
MTIVMFSVTGWMNIGSDLHTISGRWLVVHRLLIMETRVWS